MSDPVVLEESMPASTSHIIQPADGMCNFSSSSHTIGCKSKKKTNII